MGLFLLLFTIIASIVIVRVGAVALELTGMNNDIARFQSLSAFSRTGFTTREAELIVSHPQRRKIASTLMILGNAGIVTMIAAFVNTLGSQRDLPDYTVPFLNFSIPARAIPYIHLSLVVVALYVIVKLFSKHAVSSKLSESIRKKLISHNLVQPVLFEEVLVNARGYGISQLELSEQNDLVGKTLADSDLKANDILVLSVERGSRYMTNPPANIKFQTKDKLICFGNMENMRKYICKEEESKQESQQR